eukprot:2086405-Rhodomonas_salina.3
MALCDVEYCDSVCGTELGYGAMRCGVYCCAVCGTERATGQTRGLFAKSPAASVLIQVKPEGFFVESKAESSHILDSGGRDCASGQRYAPALFAYATAMQHPVLKTIWCYAFTYATAMQCPVLTDHMVLRYLPTRPVYGVCGSSRAHRTPINGSRPPIILRARYAMSGTDVGYAATSTSSPTALPSTAFRSNQVSAYARAMRCPVLG